MAAPPVKSQPLHNFSLPHLKWAHKNSSSSGGGSSSQQHRFRRDQLTNPNQQLPAVTSRDDTVSGSVEEENGEAKPWKLRPRKEVMKTTALNSKKENSENKMNSNQVKSQRLRGLVEGGQQNGGVERKGKRKIWISLSREEIEEDIYALTGGKPARRPRKWPKNVQKQLDNAFPGLYLVGVAADSYRVMMLCLLFYNVRCRGPFDVNMEVGEREVLARYMNYANKDEDSDYID